MIFEQLAPTLKNRVCPEIFDCIEYIFTIQDFWATCPCSEKQSVPKIFHFIEIFFIIQDFWATCACPENFQAGGFKPPASYAYAQSFYYDRAFLLLWLPVKTLSLRAGLTLCVS